MLRQKAARRGGGRQIAAREGSYDIAMANVLPMMSVSLPTLVF